MKQTNIKEVYAICRDTEQSSINWLVGSSLNNIKFLMIDMGLWCILCRGDDDNIYHFYSGKNGIYRRNYKQDLRKLDKELKHLLVCEVNTRS